MHVCIALSLDINIAGLMSKYDKATDVTQIVLFNTYIYYLANWWLREIYIYMLQWSNNEGYG